MNTTSIFHVTKIKFNISRYKNKRGLVYGRCHELICTDKDGVETEVRLWSEKDENLITSINGRCGVTETFDCDGKLIRKEG